MNKWVCLLALMIILMFMIFMKKPQENQEDVFEPQVAGSFYSANKTSLLKNLNNLFKNTLPTYENQKIKAMIVPHAGYVFSGQTAMYGYKTLYYDLLLDAQKEYKVVVLAPSHKHYFLGIKILQKDYYQTTLGKTKIYQTKTLKEYVDNNVFLEEHAIEVQLPFIEYVFKKAKKDYSILPVLVGDVNNLREITQKLGREKTENTIFIISSDLSHFLEQSQAQAIDEKTINQILSKDVKDIDACGKNPILIANDLFKYQKTKKLHYSNSGDVSNNSSVVGYVSIIYYDDVNKNILTRVARKAIYDEFYEKTDLVDLKDVISEEYLKKQGTFVTLYKNNQLRGCIGNIFPKKTIFESIIDNAKSSAFDDPRFLPLTKDELDLSSEVDIEISILSSPETCKQEDISKGDGVILTKVGRSAVYLPQVWDQIDDKDSFLGSLCEKAGLDHDCYLSASFERFSVEIIKE